MKHVDIGKFEPLVLQLWLTGSVRGYTKISLLVLFSSCLITRGKVITCGRKINNEDVTAAIRWEMPVNCVSNQFNIPSRTLRIEKGISMAQEIRISFLFNIRTTTQVGFKNLPTGISGYCSHSHNVKVLRFQLLCFK